MARIPDATLRRLKQETDVLALVRSSGVELRRHGADWLGSLVVTPSKGLWHCLGACAAGGSVIDWVMRRDGVSFRRAVEQLLAGSADLEAELTLDPEASDAELLEAVVRFYQAQLRRSPEAIAYLKSRGLDAPRLLDTFHVGYANRTLGYRLPKRALKAGERIRSRLQGLGIFRASGHEHLRGSVVVPVRNAAGHVVQLYGRKIRDDLRAGTPKHLYLPGPLRGLWNAAALESDEVIVCESLFDAMTFWASGYRHVTSSFGTNGVSDELLRALKTRTRVLLAFDRDDAGDAAAERVARELVDAGVECYRLLFPRGQDVNAYACSVKPAAKALGVVLRAAEWLGAGPPPEASAASNSLSGGEDRTPPDAGASSSLAALPSAPEPRPSPAPPAASPAPATGPDPSLELTVEGADVHATLGARSYRVRGLDRKAGRLRVNLLVRATDRMHVDTLDLYQAKQRTAFVRAGSKELGVDEAQLKEDLGRLLLALERHRDQAPEAPDADAREELTEAERAAALELLRDPRLLDRILEDFARVGLVGEETNKLVGYLAAVSRKLAEPLAVIVQSSSAAGKTSLMDAVLDFVPDEERVQYSALTGQSLFYMQGKDLAHKILAIVEEEGAERASYALKLLQSEGELTIASTGKEPETGKLVTHEYHVVGPVMIMLTTTAVEIDEELLNRAIVLAVDEARTQTRAIHRRQREKRTLEGLLARRSKDDVLALHRNAQRLLRPLAVVNAYAPRLTFLDTRTRTRRDHEKYLTLIDVIALVHQHQRPVRRIERGTRVIEYIEVIPEDIRIANRLAGEVLGRSLDELPPQTRRVLGLLEAWVRETASETVQDDEPVRFTARDVRDALSLGVSQTKVHLARLVELEYLIVHRSVPGRPYLYELLYQGEGQDGRAFLPGLLDPDTLGAPPGYDPERPESKTERPDPGRGPVGQQPGGGRTRSTILNRLPRLGSAGVEPPGAAADGAEVPESYDAPALNGGPP